MLPNFEDIESNSKESESNEFFSQFTNHRLPTHYDSNFVVLHYNPTLPEFQLIEKMHLEYQVSIGQKHLHFYWPENTGLFVDILDYLNKENYEIGMQELLYIQPKNFKISTPNEHVQLAIVEQPQLHDFLTLNYEEDLRQSKELAEHKSDVYSDYFEQSHVKFLLASIDGQPVGSLILISSEKYLEVDNVLTDQNFRNKGIASRMLQAIMEKAEAEEKEVILLADSEDSPKEMYLKQGFISIATRIQAQKKRIKP